MQTATSNILALDYGERRTGVAIASPIAKLPHPLPALQGGNHVQDVVLLIAQEDVGLIVVGLPRGMQGQETGQTRKAVLFAEKLAEATGIRVEMQDEALTSVQAEAELSARGGKYEKGMVDSLAAVYILEDYLRTMKGN